MIKRLISFTMMACVMAPAEAQTIALFTVDQPPRFLVAAGDDQSYTGVPIQIGGQPTATGGGGEYTYLWSPSDGLDDIASPNPVVSGLNAAVVYNVLVTDIVSGCIKSDSVELTYDVSTSALEIIGGGILLYPNPTANTIQVEGTERITSFVLYSLTGQEVMRPALEVSRRVTVDLTDISDGVYMALVTSASGYRLTHRLCKSTFAH